MDTLKDLPAVSLMTVHSAKGLEFTSVFLTGMEEEVFPYRGVEGDSPEELDEERRLAYVAITRARQRLWITHASMRTLFGQTRYLGPSRFLADLPPEVVRREGSGFGARRLGAAQRLFAALRQADGKTRDGISEEPRLRAGRTRRRSRSLRRSGVRGRRIEPESGRPSETRSLRRRSDRKHRPSGQRIDDCGAIPRLRNAAHQGGVSRVRVSRGGSLPA